MDLHQQRHQLALGKMKNFVGIISELMEVITEIEVNKTHIALGYSSLWSYLTIGLKMSECYAYQFISVTRKAREVPALKAAIDSGEVSLPKAALIVSELKTENQDAWLEIAKKKTSREIRQEVVKARPLATPQERITARTEELSELKVGLKKEVIDQIRRVQDILSQKLKRPAKLDETLAALAESFLQKNDKVRKAEKLLCASKVKPIPTGRVTLPAWITHRVQSASQGQCCAKLPNGSRCPERRFLEIHHKQPLSHGGTNHPSNLILLCHGHHSGRHLPKQASTLYSKLR